MLKINLSDIDFKSMKYNDLIIWFLQNLNNISSYNLNLGGVEIPEKDIGIIFNTRERDCYLEEALRIYLIPIITDKDFFRAHNMQNYDLHYVVEHGYLYLKDFTDDFVDLYLEYKFGIKSSSSKNSISNDECLKLGKLEYKNNDLFFDDERLHIPPQGLMIMKKFITENVSGSKYFAYDDICDAISSKKQVSIESMQKLISKLRTTINSKTKDFSIISQSNTGYTFVLKNFH